MTRYPPKEQVILNLSSLTESVMIELWALDELEPQDRTFVVIGEGFPIDCIEDEEVELLQGFPNLGRENDPNLKDRISEFIGLLTA